MQNVAKKQSLWNRIEQYIKINHMRYLERKYGRDVIKPALVNYGDVNNILVLRQHDQLGDFLLSTPVLRALREHFPKARIGVVVRDYFADTVEKSPFVDEILIFHEDGKKWTLRKLRAFWKQLRSGWDMAIVLNTVSHSLTTDLIAHFSKAKYILGSEHKVFAECSRNFFYNLVAPYWPNERHQTDRNLDIVRHIGVDTNDLTENMHIDSAEIAAAGKVLIDLDFQPGQLTIGMHVGAGKMFNRWPIGRFGELAQLLKERHDVQIVLFWGPGEQQLSEHFCKYTQFDPIKVPPSTIRKLAASFKNCDAIVCNDTGVMHLAAAADVPLVAIFGPTDPAEWKPIGDKFVALRGNRKSTDAISVEHVYSTLGKLLPQKIRISAELSETLDQSFHKDGIKANFDISESVLDRIDQSLKNYSKAMKE